MSDIRHIQGSRNAAADDLSYIHLETNALLNSSQPIDFSAIATAQQNDPEELKVSTVPLPSALCCASTRYNNHRYL